MTKRVQDIARKAMIEHPDYTVDTETDDVRSALREASGEIAEMRSAMSSAQRISGELERAYQEQERANEVRDRAQQALDDAEEALSAADDKVDGLETDLAGAFDGTSVIDAEDAAARIADLERFIAEASRYA